LYGARPGVTLDAYLVTGLVAGELEPLVRSLAVSMDRAPRDAGLERSSGRLITPLSGAMVDVGATVDAVLSAAPGSKVSPVMLPVWPRYTTADIFGLTRDLGSYATMVAGSAERRHNIRLAASLLDYTLLYPGQSFSFNLMVGPVTASRGFRLAPVMLGEDLVPGVGGGICQVATTLFNAALSAGLPILERHPHSRPVAYVAPGRDATVAQYYKDLRFRNTTGQLLLVRAGYDDHRVWFKLLGPIRP